MSLPMPKIVWSNFNQIYRVIVVFNDLYKGDVTPTEDIESSKQRYEAMMRSNKPPN